MKRIGWILMVLMLASPAWAAKKITMQQLKDMLTSMQQAKKSDAEVAAALKQVELSEAMTVSSKNALANLVPASFPLTTEQIYVLEARSATMPPPASDIPATPAPDAAAQKALLDKAADYASKTFAQLPAMTATRTTLRFQDNVEAVASSSGMHSSAQVADPNLVNASQFIHYINSMETPVELRGGVEQVPTAKDKTNWGANAQIALQEQGPVLNTVIQEAQAAGKISWLRWEVVNGKAAAVFSFVVDKKKSRYAVNYCCFPDLDQTGVMTLSSSAVGSLNGGSGGGAKGNLQTNTTWKNFKATVPYHGELFIDPDTGIVVRLITFADFKTSDLVHQEDERIDFGPVTMGGKMVVLPMKTVINTEVVPNGDSGAGKFTLRRTLFSSEYKNFQPAS